MWASSIGKVKTVSYKFYCKTIHGRQLPDVCKEKDSKVVGLVFKMNWHVKSCELQVTTFKCSDVNVNQV